jgi:hypothetical protein
MCAYRVAADAVPEEYFSVSPEDFGIHADKRPEGMNEMNHCPVRNYESVDIKIY